ncbi:unnamed protein product [Durusdinium trenchii]|uniref:Uncharacterized protein n=2 Tax=Durusdinium trenchii TaxID=1381693 RepID=A0ABP0LCZ9_9DINO
MVSYSHRVDAKCLSRPTSGQETRTARLRGEAEPEVDWSLIADRINKRFKYKPGRAAFCPEEYLCYEDWFLRKLSEKTHGECLAQAALADVCTPVQGRLWPQVPSGEMTLKVSVIAMEELLRLLQGDQLLQLRLRWPDYHRVHSPVDGTIESIKRYEKDQLFPTSESMSIFKFATSFGPVQLLCIGEWSVQSFQTHAVAGQEVRKMDELGHFDVGSQVILALPKSLHILPKEGARMFVGDPIAAEHVQKKEQVVRAILGRGAMPAFSGRKPKGKVLRAKRSGR